jgi:F-type H+-transporting ATPase subunit delta
MSMNITRNSQIANRYARALFLAAGETRIEFDEELKKVLKVLEDPVVSRVFYHPRTARERKAELIRLMQLSPVLQSFLLLVMEKGREALLPFIAQDFERLVLEEQNTTVAEVTSAVEMRSEERNALERRLSTLTGKKVLLRTAVDPGVGGGLVIKVDGKVLDASLKHRLELFAQSITN